MDKGTMKKRKKNYEKNIDMKKRKKRKKGKKKKKLCRRQSRRHSCGIGQMAGALRIDDVASMPTAAVGIGGGRCASDR